jgi:hypothetical protein
MSSLSFPLNDFFESEKLEHDEFMYFVEDFSELLTQHDMLNEWHENTQNVSEALNTLDGSMISTGGREDDKKSHIFEWRYDDVNQTHVPSREVDFDFDGLSVCDEFLDEPEGTESSVSCSSFESQIEETKMRLQESMRRSQQTRLCVYTKTTKIDVYDPEKLRDAIESAQESTLRLQSYLM